MPTLVILVPKWQKDDIGSSNEVGHINLRALPNQHIVSSCSTE
jgi:hypothetical protein